MDICLRVLKGKQQIRFDSYGVRNSELIVSHISFRDCRVHIISGTQRQFSENICTEDDLRSRMFGTFVVKFHACLPLLGLTDFYPKRVS